MITETKTIQLYETAYLIDGERIKVFYQELRLAKDIRRENNIGNLEGYIDIVYPFAGLDLKMTLEIYTEIDEEGNLDGFFKVPFAENKISLSEILFLLHLEEEFNSYLEDEMESDYEKCSCGGHIMPMYEEFPDWITFCNRCDSRSENTFASPIKEPF